MVQYILQHLETRQVLKIQITDTSITSANIYYGKSLISLVDESLTNILAFDGDIQNRLKNLSASLKDFRRSKNCSR